MKKLQDELLLNKVRRSLGGEGQRNRAGIAGVGISLAGRGRSQKGADSDLASPTSSPRSSSWLRWSGCRWRLTSFGGGHRRPTPVDSNFTVPTGPPWPSTSLLLPKSPHPPPCPPETSTGPSYF